MDLEIIAWILSAVLAILIAILGTKYYGVLKEVKDVFKALSDALDDDKITKDELLNITKEAKEALAAIKGIFKKGEVSPTTP